MQPTMNAAIFQMKMSNPSFSKKLTRWIFLHEDLEVAVEASHPLLELIDAAAEFLFDLFE